MSWKQFYFSPDGRVIRREWWFRFFLPLLVIWVGAAIVDTALYLALQYTQHAILEILFYLQFYPWFVVNVKRFHDRNKSGWWVLITLIPILGDLWLVVECGCLRGTIGDNRYGPDPLAGNSAANPVVEATQA